MKPFIKVCDKSIFTPMRMAALSLVTLIVLVCSCGKDGSVNKKLPTDFSQMTDRQKMDWVMKNLRPDSAARFLGRVALGEEKNVKLDTFATSLLYLYDSYREENLEIFTASFESFKKSLPLDRKMKLYLISGDFDTLNMGYQLGLEYVARIRDYNLKVSDIEREMNDLRKACDAARDTATFLRFSKGFELALREDSGKDLSSEVYHRFITPTYEEN